MQTRARSLAAALLCCLALAACRPESQTAAESSPPADMDRDDPGPAQRVHYQCGELAVGASFESTGERVLLTYSGRRLELPIAVSASGARYADEAGNEFWTKGDEATLALAGEEQRDCSETDHVSPWEQAAERGVAFRAIGQEPGWLVEVGPGEAPPLSAQLDYGERSVEVARTTPTLAGEASGFEGETADGTPVALEIRRGECADPMSGERFEASARLRVGEQAYEGCGAFLSD